MDSEKTKVPILSTYKTSGLTTMSQLTDFTANIFFSRGNNTSATEDSVFMPSPIIEEEKLPFFNL